MSIVRMQQRRGTAEDWESIKDSVVLASGEMGLETDTGKFKIGDGSSYWSGLSYFVNSLSNTTLGWSSTGSIVPESGQVCVDTTTGYFKVGNGVDDYSTLAPFYDINAIINEADSGFQTFGDIQPKLVPDGGTTGQVLKKSGSADYFVDWYSISTSDLTDFNLADEAQGHYLKYNATSGKWENFMPVQIFVQETEPTGNVGDLWFW